MEKTVELDRQYEEAESLVLTRYAPGAIRRRVRWSQGETTALELGDGPPLLYVHGGLSAAFEWLPMFSTLSQTHRVIAVDRPGHGSADPFDYGPIDFLTVGEAFLRDVMDALDLETTILVANSLGGLMSSYFTLSHADRVSKLVLVGAPMGAKRAVPMQVRLPSFPVIGRPLGRMAMSNPTRDGNRRFWQILVAHPERIDDILLDADVASQRRNLESHLTLFRCVGGLRGLRHHLVLGDRWHAMGVPTLFVWGERDAFAAPEVGETLAAKISNAHVARVPDAGHLPWIDDPETVGAEITCFLSDG
ncbi:MAG TPA: alpha/beta hydrolase [Actinomycetota bacterium]